jgi:hypothetical protein
MALFRSAGWFNRIRQAIGGGLLGQSSSVDLDAVAMKVEDSSSPADGAGWVKTVLGSIFQLYLPVGGAAATPVVGVTGRLPQDWAETFATGVVGTWHPKANGVSVVRTTGAGVLGAGAVGRVITVHDINPGVTTLAQIAAAIVADAPSNALLGFSGVGVVGATYAGGAGHDLWALGTIPAAALVVLWTDGFYWPCEADVLGAVKVSQLVASDLKCEPAQTDKTKLVATAHGSEDGTLTAAKLHPIKVSATGVQEISGTVTEASAASALTALQLIDDPIVAPDAVAASKSMQASGVAYASPASLPASVSADGDSVPLSTDRKGVTYTRRAEQEPGDSTSVPQKQVQMRGLWGTTCAASGQAIPLGTTGVLTGLMCAITTAGTLNLRDGGAGGTVLWAAPTLPIGGYTLPCHGTISNGLYIEFIGGGLLVGSIVPIYAPDV